MRTNDRNFRDVGEMTNRLTIDLFKRNIHQAKMDPEQLRGSWAEACYILRTHFGKVSRIMIQNEYELHNLYRTAIKELRQI
jgi:hypothetical protein